MAKFRDIYPDFAGVSTKEESIPEQADQNALESSNTAPEKITISTKKSAGILGWIILFLVAVFFLQAV